MSHRRRRNTDEAVESLLALGRIDTDHPPLTPVPTLSTTDVTMTEPSAAPIARVKKRRQPSTRDRDAPPTIPKKKCRKATSTVTIVQSPPVHAPPTTVVVVGGAGGVVVDDDNIEQLCLRIMRDSSSPNYHKTCLKAARDEATSMSRGEGTAMNMRLRRMSACMFVMTSGKMLRDHVKKCGENMVLGTCSICSAPIQPDVKRQAIARMQCVSDISHDVDFIDTSAADRGVAVQQTLADLRSNYRSDVHDTSVAYALRCCNMVVCDMCVRVWAALYRIVSAQRLKSKSMWTRRIPHCVCCNKLPTLDIDVESVLTSSLMTSSIKQHNERERLCGVSERSSDNASSSPPPLFSTADLIGIPGDERGSLIGRFISSMEIHDTDSATIMRAIFLGGEMRKTKLKKDRSASDTQT